jgi:hypothetical protein
VRPLHFANLLFCTGRQACPPRLPVPYLLNKTRNTDQRLLIFFLIKSVIVVFSSCKKSRCQYLTQLGRHMNFIKIALAAAALCVSASSFADTTCRADSFGTTRCSNGQTFRTDSFGTTRDNQGNSWRTDSFGTTRGSDGSNYRTDSFGTTRDNNGNSWRTDSFGTTRGSNGSTCRTDSFGTMRCN